MENIISLIIFFVPLVVVWYVFLMAVVYVHWIGAYYNIRAKQDIASDLCTFILPRMPSKRQ